MPESCILYYITDRKAFPGNERDRSRLLLEKIDEAASAGIDYIQLREKDLSTRDLESLAREAIQIIRNNAKPKTALLINSRTDVALASEAQGVHLPANDLSPNEIRQIWRCGAGAPSTSSGQALAREISPSPPQISISCHSPEEVTQAATNAATLAIFAPVFEKKDAPGNAPAGLEALRKACQATIPVLALGGITQQNAASCLQAGAAGIAAIRLFQENSIAQIVRSLRSS
ncbi:MAG: thiamine phosphate synthase [Candidatus Sulfotelmatobacter sp.]